MEEVKNERRMSLIQRKCYSAVEKCYNCSGNIKSVKECDSSIYLTKINLCLWRDSVNKDLEKIAKDSNDCMEFPILKKIVERNKYEI